MLVKKLSEEKKGDADRGRRKREQDGKRKKFPKSDADRGSFDREERRVSDIAGERESETKREKFSKERGDSKVMKSPKLVQESKVINVNTVDSAYCVQVGDKILGHNKRDCHNIRSWP